VQDPSDMQFVKEYDYETSAQENVIVNLTRLRDDEFESRGFTLNQPMDLRIYAIGEGTGSDMADYGWIVDAKTHKKIWEMRYRRTEHAGGASKNRLSDEVVHFDKGSYFIYFVTDGSHSYRDWNSSAPYDQESWGITVSAADENYNPEDVSEFKGIDENVIVSLTRLRDDEFESKGFTLNKPMDLRIYAIGEGSGRDLADYGWIVDANTHKKVWEMRYHDSDHAGGASKNRMVNEVMHFNAGSYIVYFVTDGSHSYRDWNSSPPFDQESFGITVTAAGEDFKAEDISDFEKIEESSVLARLVRMRDDERERQRFTLTKDSEVRIYAIGEGTRSDMVDYGWIEDAETGRVVWEMTYRRTDPAGGARKNRMFDGTIMLKAGEYILYYDSDGSHSFNDWNDDPPFDPVNWGITVYLVEDK